MSIEKGGVNQTENKEPSGIEKKIHQTHFPVLKIPVQNGDHNSSFEWVSSGNGRFKLVPRKTGDK